MASLMLRPEQDVILSSYWPYGVTVHWVQGQPDSLKPVSGKLTRLTRSKSGEVAQVTFEREGKPAVNFRPSEVVLELHALEDLPHLVGGRPLEQVVRRLRLWDTRYEQYVQVRVLDSWLNHLTLEVETSDFLHEVKLSSWGNIMVRDVRADRRASSRSLAEMGSVALENWQPLLGQQVLDVYELLRRLHVAVGPVADCQQSMREGKPYGEPEHYVRKALPVQEEEEVTND